MEELKRIQKMLNVDEEQAARTISTLRATIQKNKKRIADLGNKVHETLEEKRILEYQTEELQKTAEMLSGTHIAKPICTCDRQLYARHDNNCALIVGGKNV